MITNPTTSTPTRPASYIVATVDTVTLRGRVLRDHGADVTMIVESVTGELTGAAYPVMVGSMQMISKTGADLY